MNKARITYRFDQNRDKENGKDTGNPVKVDKVVIPLFQEEFQVIEDKLETEPLNAFTTDFGSWNSPFETESERVERLIRDSAFEAEKSAPTRQPEGKRVEGPEVDPEVWSSWMRNEARPDPMLGARYVKSSATPWFRIATSVAAAVITGIAFGLFVLSMFTSSDKDLPADSLSNDSQASQTNVQTQKDTTPSVKVTTNEGKADQSAAGAAGTSGTANSAVVKIAAKSYSFLQNGVFSSVQSAQAAQAELKKKGFASSLQQGDKSTVFIGFALNRDDALSISQQLQEHQLEVFIKNMDLPDVSTIRWNGSKPESLAPYIAQGDKLIQMLSGLTLVHLAETKQTALDDSSLQAMRSAHQTWTTLAAALNDGADKEIKPLVEQMNTALNSSIQSMEEYKKNPSPAMLWQTQSSMMQYILTQKKLLTEIRIS
jgi:stage II sporulation protein B